MRRPGLKVHLGIWFILAVMAPSFILGVLAFRTMTREEAFLEKRLEDSLRTEVDHVATLLRGEMQAIENELALSLNNAPPSGSLAAWAARWQRASTLAGPAFLVSPGHEILWPAQHEGAGADDIAFLKWSANFLSNAEATPVYDNIAHVYKDSILKDAQRMEQQTVSADQTYWGSSGDYSSSRKRSSQAQQELYENISSQYSPAVMQQSAPVRAQAYEQARSKGQQVVQRKVMPVKSLSFKGDTNAVPQAEESIFIANEMTFSQITGQKSSGIIPFMVKENLRLVFWKKLSDGKVAGCLIDPDAVAARIIKLLPGIYSEARVLTVLDEHGKPLITPQADRQRDWRRPFVATEVSETLPRWEVAVYLTRPDAISAKAETTKALVWVLIVIMLVSIVTGGTLVLMSLNSELRLAQQKTTFAANVSHELKTPLTSIRMFAEMLREDRQPDPARRRQYLDIMVSETERLTRLINNVLDFSRMGRAAKSYRFVPLDIVELSRAVLESQRTRLEYNGFTVRFSTSAPRVLAHADEEAVKQVLINLLSNAEKYCDERKDIELAVEVRPPMAVISIADRGFGIAPEHAVKVFDEFFRVDDRLNAKTQGTGLGLTIARRIARDHGGDVIYKPREGGGSLFQLYLPLEGTRT